MTAFLTPAKALAVRIEHMGLSDVFTVEEVAGLKAGRCGACPRQSVHPAHVAVRVVLSRTFDDLTASLDGWRVSCCDRGLLSYLRQLRADRSVLGATVEVPTRCEGPPT
jgi:hypothetical protein